MPSPWGLREPEPYFDSPAGLYHVSLVKDQRSPFQPPDELHLPDKEKKKGAEDTNTVPVITIELAGHSSPSRTRAGAARQLQ